MEQPDPPRQSPLLRRQRLLFLLGSLDGGGAERQTLAWLRHLDRTRYEPFLYVISRRGALSNECPADLTIQAFEDSAPPPGLYFPGKIERQQTEHLQQFFNEIAPDGLISVALHMTRLARGIRRGPTPWFAVEMADPRRDFDDQIHHFKSIKRRQLRQAYRTAIPVAVSEGVRTGLSEFYNLPVDRIALVRNAIDISQVNLAKTEDISPWDPQLTHLVAVGRMQPQKGHVHLLEALAQLSQQERFRSLRLHLVGDGPLRPQLEEVANRLGIADQIIWEGFLKNPFALVARCQLFCLPSLYEGLPLALLEAMACGTPVIASDCPSGPREVLADGQFGPLVPLADSAALAREIANSLDNPTLVQERAATAQLHVRNHYSIETAMRAWDQLFLEIPQVQRRNS